MIKETLRKILALVIKKHRLPKNTGFLKIYDKIAKSSFYLFWQKDCFMETEIYRYGLYGRWEKQSLKIWADLAKQSYHILDIGANTGIYSMVAQNNNSQARIIAVEPIETNFAVLKKNIEQNKFAIIPEKIALANYEGNATMYMLKDKLNYMTSINDNRYALHPEIAKGSEVIETIINVKPYSFLKEKYNLHDIDLIKIDVEGHESAVLDSLYPQLESSLPSILVEIISEESAVAINKLLMPLNYKYLSIDDTEEKLKKVSGLWNNDHQNFLICNDTVFNYLQKSGFVLIN